MKSEDGAEYSQDSFRMTTRDECNFQRAGMLKARGNTLWLSLFFLLLFAVIVLQSCADAPESQSPMTNAAPAATAKNDDLTSFYDLDADGFPDVAELQDEQDRRNFRRWFVSLAESQLYKEDPAWRTDDHDCAGLIRFAYREALKKHDTDWLRSKPFLLDAAIPDVRKYNYPKVPLLKTKIFRTREGQFRETDLADTTFAVTAMAAKMRSYNTVFLGKTLENVQPGDLFFYLNAGDVNMPQHSMIFIGDPRKPASYEDAVIYHTGPRDEEPGVLKKVRLLDLLRHPDDRWHPAPENQYFLGFYRWKILD